MVATLLFDEKKNSGNRNCIRSERQKQLHFIAGETNEPLCCLEFPISFNEMLIFVHKHNLNLDRKCLFFSRFLQQRNANITEYDCTMYMSSSEGCPQELKSMAESNLETN